MCYRATVRLLAAVHAHVNEQLVASVERPVAARTSGPEAGEIFGSSLVDVRTLDMLHQIFLTVKSGFTVDPAAGERIQTGRVVVDGRVTGPAAFAAVRVFVQRRRELEGLVVMRRRRQKRRVGLRRRERARSALRASRADGFCAAGQIRRIERRELVALAVEGARQVVDKKIVMRILRRPVTGG